MNLIFAYITNPNQKEAERIARYLLKKRLIGCVNIFPSESLYWWKKRIKKEKEFILIAKTTKANFEKVKKEVEKIHSYSIPCIVKIPVVSNKKFSDWLQKTINYSKTKIR